MTVVYPKDGKQDFSFHTYDDSFQVVENETDVRHYTMLDDVILHVEHKDDAGGFNYKCEFSGTTHNFYTIIDTKYHSKNLKKIIENCIIYERLWF